MSDSSIDNVCLVCEVTKEERDHLEAIVSRLQIQNLEILKQKDALEARMMRGQQASFVLFGLTALGGAAFGVGIREWMQYGLTVGAPFLVIGAAMVAVSLFSGFKVNTGDTDDRHY